MEVELLLALYISALDDADGKADFGAVYDRYKRLVYHTAYKITKDPYLAEDVLQEVFLYVAKNFSKIRRQNGHELAAYLVSCSRSRACDLLRGQRGETLDEDEERDRQDAAPMPEDAAVSADAVARLTACLAQLKPIYRDPLRLLALGYSYAEIAAALGVTQDLLRKRISRGRDILRRELEKDEEKE